jgi:hypothetical protein
MCSTKNNIQKSGACNSTFVIGVHFAFLFIVEGWGYNEKPCSTSAKNYPTKFNNVDISDKKDSTKYYIPH